MRGRREGEEEDVKAVKRIDKRIQKRRKKRRKLAEKGSGGGGRRA